MMARQCQGGEDTTAAVTGVGASVDGHKWAGRVQGPQLAKCHDTTVIARCPYAPVSVENTNDYMHHHNTWWLCRKPKHARPRQHQHAKVNHALYTTLYCRQSDGTRTTLQEDSTYVRGHTHRTAERDAAAVLQGECLLDEGRQCGVTCDEVTEAITCERHRCAITLAHSMARVVERGFQLVEWGVCVNCSVEPWGKGRRGCC